MAVHGPHLHSLNTSINARGQPLKRTLQDRSITPIVDMVCLAAGRGDRGDTFSYNIMIRKPNHKECSSRTPGVTVQFSSYIYPCIPYISHGGGIIESAVERSSGMAKARHSPDAPDVAKK